MRDSENKMNKHEINERYTLDEESGFVYDKQTENWLTTAEEVFNALVGLSYEEVADSIGFEKCEWGPDESCCEKCGATGKQDYFRRTSVECMDGEYFCIDCIKTEIEMNERAYSANVKSDSSCADTSHG